MKSTVCAWLLLAAVVAVSGAPAPEPAPAAAPADDSRPEIIEIIAPAANAQETLATLNLGAPGSELSERNKRTIGILRQLFPSLTQIIEQKVQQITSFVLKTFGPVFLKAFLGRNNAGGGAANGGGSGTVELDDDDDDDDDEPEPKSAVALSASATPSITTTEAPVTIAPSSVDFDEPKINADNVENNEEKIETQNEDTSEEKTQTQSEDINEEKTETQNEDTSEEKTQTQSEDINEEKTETQNEENTETQSEDKNEVTEKEEDRRRRKRALFFVPNAIVEENQLLSGAESQQAEVRVAFGDGQSATDQQAAASEDQQTAAANLPIDEISLNDADDTEENRNKRFLSFGGNSGGGGGGSGNFLFDIVRQAPGAMARAAGSAFRLFAGTDSLNVGLTASHTASLDPNDPQLVAGSSSGSSGGDAGAGEGDDGSAAKGDNLTEGVPGPITRLFIIANRGIANLIQDLILRIAQTSERIVNFKARLITSII